MKKVLTILAAALLLGACHCAKCTTKPNRSNTCAKMACKCKYRHKTGCVCPKKAVKQQPPAMVVTEDKALQDVVAVNKKSENLTVLSFKEPINFEINSDKLDANSTARVKQVASALKKYPNNAIRVTGHTDSIGNPDYNVDLSQRRAKAVAMALVEEGVAADKVSFVGYGATKPVATNKTRAGRAQNRRVELEVTNK